MFHMHHMDPFWARHWRRQGIDIVMITAIIFAVVVAFSVFVRMVR